MKIESLNTQHYNGMFVIKEFNSKSFNNDNDMKCACLEYIDNLLNTFNKKTLSCALNDMQTHFSCSVKAEYKDNELWNEKNPFYFKQNIPLYFWNLYLLQYNLKVVK
ncbi:MAG: hypothetical protein NC222_06315 [Staphylococcus sp.]|nr:hypothetical protein [Staphylococcus sp.]